MRQIALITALITLSLSSLARQNYFDELMQMPIAQKTKTAPIEFHGLWFTAEGATTVCTRNETHRLICDIRVRQKNDVSAQAQMIFERVSISTRASIPLMRLKRKEEWVKRFPIKNQYLEEDITLGDFKSRLQQARYFRFDNINWPVLIRAIDVVVNEGTSISVTTTCDVRDWPVIKDVSGTIEQSFMKAK